MQIEQRIYNGDRAREVLENEAFQQVIEDLKQEITQQWQTSPARDPGGREKLWLMLSLTNKLEILLKSSLDSGTLARVDLKHQQTLAERAKSMLGME